MKRFIARAILNTIGVLLCVTCFGILFGIFYALGGWPLVIGVILFTALIMWCTENAD